jgi:hypothetical protein
MKTILISILTLLSISAYSQTRDSLYSEKATATSTTVSITFTDVESARLHRVMGANWSVDIKNFLLNYAQRNDNFKIDEYNKIQASKLGEAEKQEALKALEISDPKEITVIKSTKVPAVVGTVEEEVIR